LVSEKLRILKVCQYNDTQSSEEGSRAKSRNVAYIEQISKYGHCPALISMRTFEVEQH